MRKEIVHLIGGFLIVSSFYHSDMGLLSLLTIIPIVSVSIGVDKEVYWVQYTGLIIATLLSSYLITHKGLANIFYLIQFITSFVLPLVIYWKVVLSFDLHFDPKASVLGASYFSVTVITFYGLIEFLNVSDYILSVENPGPMALAFGAVTLLVLIPYYIVVSR